MESGSSAAARIGAASRNLPAATDEELLGLCARRHAPALEELIRRHQSSLYRFLLRLTASPEDAEEAVQDVFVRAWQNAGRFQYRAKVATWLYRIAVNISRDIHSRKKSRPQDPWPEDHELDHLALDSAEDDALKSVERQRQTALLEKCLSKLHPGDRAILILYYLEEREYDEIQEITGLSYTVLKTRLARARKRLRQVMEKEGSEA
jgi:RNA polymerase sigma-70 factor (ECF subfamily)